MDKKYILTAITITILIILSVLFNRAIYSSMGAGNSGKKRETKAIASKEVTKKGQNLPAAQDPSKFSILTQKESNKPLNQAQSDASMKKALAQTKALDYMGKENAFDGMKLTSDEYKRRWDEINDRIKYYENIKRNKLDSSEANQKLEILYRLRSTLTLLKDKIIIKKPSP